MNVTDRPDSFVLRTRWLLRPDEIPLENARLTVEDGILTDVGPVPADEVPLIENNAILPPLWNAHCHLEFSSLQQPFGSGSNFPEWICQVMAWRAMQTPESAHAAIDDGLMQSRLANVAGLGEITTSDIPEQTLAGTDLRITSFREAIGLTDERIGIAISGVRKHLEPPVEVGGADPANSTNGRNSVDRSALIRGISPHAPYTVHPQLLTELVELSIEYDTPVSMHIAETREERQLLEDCSGPLAEMLRLFGIPVEPVGRDGFSMAEILDHLLRAPRVQIVHGNYLTPDELKLLAEHPNSTLIYCPRTHRHFGHETHPWPDLVAMGGQVALGTDGRGSNPDLDVWRDFQCLLGEAGDLPLPRLLRILTTDAAGSLGWQATGNRLQTGEPARGTVLELPGSVGQDPVPLLLDTATRPTSRF